MKKAILYIQFLLLFVTARVNTIAQDNSIYIARIDSLVQAKYNLGQFNGSILVKKGDEIIYKRAMGWADFEAKDTLKLTTPTRLASVTKSITAVCVMQLVEQGKVDLHEDINTYLPEIEKTGITVYHLLSHTSGIAYINGGGGHFNKIMKIAKDLGAIRYSNKHVLMYFEKYKPKPRFAPGNKFKYSNIGYTILASLIERVSKVGYGEYLKQNIFDPLDMKNSFLFIPAIEEKDNILPRAFSYVFGEKLDKAYAYYQYDEHGKIVLSNTMYGDKAVYSTVEDMEKFNTGFLNGELLLDKYVKLICTPVKVNSGKVNSGNYGLGIFVIRKSSNGLTEFSHTGGIAYFATINMIVKGTYQIILLQSSPQNPYELSYACYDALEGKKRSPTKQSKKGRKKVEIFNKKYKIHYK